MQHRRNFDVLLHPNTGYERMDHLRWGIWAGSAHKLDLSINSFSFALGSDPRFNCRNSPAVYPLPESTRKKEPSQGHCHIRFFNAAGMDDNFNLTPLVDGNSNGVTVPLMWMEHNWYDDLVSSAEGLHEVMILGNRGVSDPHYQIPLSPDIVRADTFITFVMLPRVSFSKIAIYYVDDFHVTEGYSKIRFINLLVLSVYVTRTVANNLSDVPRPRREVVAKLASLEPFYDVVRESQYIYDVCSSSDCSTVVATLPTYMGSGSVNTAYILDTDRGPEIIFVQDNPQDAPPDATYELR